MNALQGLFRFCKYFLKFGEIGCHVELQHEQNLPRSQQHTPNTLTMRLLPPTSRSLTAGLFLLFSVLISHSLAAVLAIDYGTEWTKAALVKPGIPLQIVLTKDTKRKEQSVVAFKGQERLYGTDEFNLVSPPAFL